MGGGDDQVVGAGGVAGVRARLVAGRGWARLGSWAALDEAVERADTGASAVVLVSYADQRREGQGHTLLRYHAADGRLWWADPAVKGCGAVTEQRPAALEGAVAVWAVVVDGDGRGGGAGWVDGAGVGGGTFRREGALADPPTRHDIGAMGGEFEWHDIRLLPADGGDELLPQKVALLRTTDRGVTLVADVSRRSGRLISVPEAVARPWNVLGERDRPDRDAVLGHIKDIDRLLSEVDEIPDGTPEAAKTLAQVFNSDKYVIDPRFSNVRVVRLEPVAGGAPLFPQLSLGGELGGGLWTVLQAVLQGMDSRSFGDRAAVLSAASEFGGRSRTFICAPRTALRRRPRRARRPCLTGMRPTWSRSPRSWHSLLWGSSAFWLISPAPRPW